MNDYRYLVSCKDPVTNYERAFGWCNFDEAHAKAVVWIELYPRCIISMIMQRKANYES